MNFSHVFGLCFVNFSTFYHRRCKDTLCWSSCTVICIRTGLILEWRPKHDDAGTIGRNGETSSSRSFLSPHTT